MHLVFLAGDLLVNHPEVTPKEVAALVQVDRGFDRIRSFGVLVLEKIRYAQRTVKRRRGLDTQSALQLLHGVRVTPLDAVEAGQSAVYDRIVRSELNRALELGLRLCVTPAAFQEQSHKQMGIPVARPFLE